MCRSAPCCAASGRSCGRSARPGGAPPSTRARAGARAGWARRSPTRRRGPTSPSGAALTGFGFGQLVLVVLGVLVGAGEHATGMAMSRSPPCPGGRGCSGPAPSSSPSARRWSPPSWRRLRAGRGADDRGARRRRPARSAGAAAGRAPGGRGGARRRPRARRWARCCGRPPAASGSAWCWCCSSRRCWPRRAGGSPSG